MEKSLFYLNLPKGFEAQNNVEQRLLAEYGSVFVAQNVQPPARIVFKDEDDVAEFQSTLSIASELIGGFEMELQTEAMHDLQKAIVEANRAGLSITPRDRDSARRNYDETVSLWASRVEPALEHWVGEGRMRPVDADRIRSLSPFDQVSEVLKLEDEGVFFSKDLSKSIIYSVAPPGTSQHLSMLAFDVREFDDPAVREILARHKWFQTVVSDLPHFSYLGLEENVLLDLGLKKVVNSERTFWVPDL